MIPVRSGIDARVAPGGAAGGPEWQVVYDIGVRIKSYQSSASMSANFDECFGESSRCLLVM